MLDEVGGENLWVSGVNPLYANPLYATKLNKLTLDPSKEWSEVFASDVIRQTTVAGFDVTIYKPLLDTLINAAGYTEYKANNDPRIPVASRCDLSQKNPNKPHSLFVFAYDWRRSNVENAAKLKDYIGCVRQFHPGKKVNFLTHSMGGLVARRYILDNPGTHNVNKMVTIAAPWLGAPKAIYVLETGEFFDGFLQNFLFNSTIKQLVEFYPGMHQLLPSRWYYELGGRPFKEESWNINADNRLGDIYTPDQVYTLLDRRFTRSTPGRTGAAFHDNPGQDDWRNDQTGVKYIHIYAEQKGKNTIVQVLAKTRSIHFGNGGFRAQTYFDTVRGEGDGTVPLLSARRFHNGVNLNSGYNALDDQAYKIVQSPSEDLDELAQHNGMTQNPELLKEIFSMLRYQADSMPIDIGDPPQARRQQKRLDKSVQFANAGFKNPVRRERKPGVESKATNLSNSALQDSTAQTPGDSTVRLDTSELTPMQYAPSYYLTFVGIGEVTMTDIYGRSNVLNGNGVYEPIPNVIIDSLGENAVQVVTSTKKEYTIKFRMGDEPILLDIIKGVGNVTPMQVIRYVDMVLPANVTAMLKMTAQGVEDLRYDADGDGTFESTLTPTVSVSGALARDTEPPVISFSEKLQGSKRLVTINAADSGSGVKIVRYSLDGMNYQTYTSPILVDPARMQTITVSADDNVANRVSFVTYKPLVPTLRLSRDSNTREILVTITVQNDSNATLIANLALNSAKLNGKPTTTRLPLAIGTLGEREVATRTIRFPANAAAPNSRATLFGSGAGNGGVFSGSTVVTVP